MMSEVLKPKLPLPEPLRGAELGSFAHNTIAVRLPDIARRVLAENDFPPDVVSRLESLIMELPDGRIRPLTDVNDWDDYTKLYPNHTWLEPPWFFVETYFYRRILEATGYFGAGPTAGVDPFAQQKQHGLTVTMDNSRALAANLAGWLAEGWQEAAFRRLLAVDLWGNQADLSMWPVDSTENPNHTDQLAQQEHLLVDETTAVFHHLMTRLPDYSTTRLDFIIDNAGFELVCDLCLADYLLSSRVCAAVRFHLKNHPTFVSDALIHDVETTVAYLANDGDEHVGAVAGRLAGYRENGRFQLHTHPYWTSPLPGWEMPADLRADLNAAALIISKGDANYRRLIGDRHWPYTTPFAAVVSYFPAPLVALRSLKSNVTVGLAPNQPSLLDQKDPNWLVNGRWGLIQFMSG